MRMRTQLFRYVLEDLGLHLFFVDADIVFLHDPWPFVAVRL
jgi:hypothetical protein